MLLAKFMCELTKKNVLLEQYTTFIENVFKREKVFYNTFIIYAISIES